MSLSSVSSIVASSSNEAPGQIITSRYPTISASHEAFLARLPKEFVNSFTPITGPVAPAPIRIPMSNEATVLDEHKSERVTSTTSSSSQHTVAPPILLPLHCRPSSTSSTHTAIGPVAEIVANIKTYNYRMVEGDTEERLYRNFNNANRREVLEANNSEIWDKSGVLPDNYEKIYFDRAPGSGLSWIGHNETLNDIALGVVLSTKSDAPGRYVALYLLSHGHSHDGCAVFLKERLPEYLKSKLLPVLGNPHEVYNVLKKMFVHLGHEYEKSPQATKYTGATAIAAIVIDQDLYVANVGNCAAFFSHNGDAIGLSNMPSPCDPYYADGVIIRGGKIIEREDKCVVDIGDDDVMTITRVIGHSEKYGIHARANIIYYSLSSTYMGEPDGQDYLIMGNSEVAAAASPKQMAQTVHESAKKGFSSLQIAQELLSRINMVFLGECRNASLLVIPVADIKAGKIVDF